MYENLIIRLVLFSNLNNAKLRLRDFIGYFRLPWTGMD